MTAAAGLGEEVLTVSYPATGVLQLTLNRPRRMNALTDEMFDGFVRICQQVEIDDRIRVVVVTGAGRGFCAGLDLDVADGLADTPAPELLRRQQGWARSIAVFRQLSKPVIAAVNGAAAGAGFALALAADIRVASTAARFNAAFVRIGLSGGDVGTSWMLPRIVGLGHAYDILLTGRFVEAAEAERIGLVNRTVPPEALLPAAYELAAAIAQHSPLGVTLTKQVLQQNVDAPSLEAAITVENTTQVLATRSEDMREALAAFRERRAASYTHR